MERPISMIVAVSTNNVIGKDGRLPWHLPAEMAYFKRMTTPHVVLHGRKSYMSISEKYRPLIDRVNGVITRNPNFDTNFIHKSSSTKLFRAPSLEAGIAHSRTNFADKEIYLAGGGEIYREGLDKADTLGIDTIYLTRVAIMIEGGDTFFPELNPRKWRLADKIDHRPDEKNLYAFSLERYERIKSSI